MLAMFDLIQLWQVDSNCVELEQIGVRMLLAFCANGVLDVSLSAGTVSQPSFSVILSASVNVCLQNSLSNLEGKWLGQFR